MRTTLSQYVGAVLRDAASVPGFSRQLDELEGCAQALDEWTNERQYAYCLSQMAECRAWVEAGRPGAMSAFGPEDPGWSLMLFLSSRLFASKVHVEVPDESEDTKPADPADCEPWSYWGKGPQDLAPIDRWILANVPNLLELRPWDTETHYQAWLDAGAPGLPTSTPCEPLLKGADHAWDFGSRLYLMKHYLAVEGPPPYSLT
jgi:hypothetical protein